MRGLTVARASTRPTHLRGGCIRDERTGIVSVDDVAEQHQDAVLDTHSCFQDREDCLEDAPKLPPTSSPVPARSEPNPLIPYASQALGHQGHSHSRLMEWKLEKRVPTSRSTGVSIAKEMQHPRSSTG